MGKLLLIFDIYKGLKQAEHTNLIYIFEFVKNNVYL